MEILVVCDVDDQYTKCVCTSKYRLCEGLRSIKMHKKTYLDDH